MNLLVIFVREFDELIDIVLVEHELFPVHVIGYDYLILLANWDVIQDLIVIRLSHCRCHYNYIYRTNGKIIQNTFEPPKQPFTNTFDIF
jgi:hypothetical protein